MKYFGTTSSDKDIATKAWANTNKMKNLRVVALTGGAVDLSLGDVFTYTITGDTTFTVSNPETVSCFSLLLTNGGAGVITYPPYTKWSDDTEPTLQEEGLDLITFLTINGGNTWIGTTTALDLQ